MATMWRFGICLLGLGLLHQTAAAPAYWYKWQSKVTGNYICKQTDPGPGWVRHSGPYIDGGCRTLLQPPRAL